MDWYRNSNRRPRFPFLVDFWQSIYTSSLPFDICTSLLSLHLAFIISPLGASIHSAAYTYCVLILPDPEALCSWVWDRNREKELTLVHSINRLLNGKKLVTGHVEIGFQGIILGWLLACDNSKKGGWTPVWILRLHEVLGCLWWCLFTAHCLPVLSTCAVKEWLYMDFSVF